jgi:hypothetical protein
MNAVGTVYGIPVVTSWHVPRKPKIALSPEAPVSLAFRADFDLWLQQRFGYEVGILIMDPERAGLPGGKMVIVHTEDWPEVRASLEKDSLWWLSQS